MTSRWFFHVFPYPRIPVSLYKYYLYMKKVCLSNNGRHPLSSVNTTYSLYRKDPDSSWFCIIPISILQYIDETYQGGATRQQVITDLAWIDFFLLLRSGEYFQGFIDTVSTPFHLQYIQSYVDGTPFPATTANPYNCAIASFSASSSPLIITASKEIQ